VQVFRAELVDEGKMLDEEAARVVLPAVLGGVRQRWKIVTDVVADHNRAKDVWQRLKFKLKKKEGEGALRRPRPKLANESPEKTRTAPAPLSTPLRRYS
jgi:hypothetical protein